MGVLGVFVLKVVIFSCLALKPNIELGKVRFFLGGGGLGPQRGGSTVKLTTKRGGPYLM